MVDFAANFTILKRLSKIVHFTWKVLSLKDVHLPIACQTERSLRYFYHVGLAICSLFIARVPSRC